jgi:hypothetical protein
MDEQFPHLGLRAWPFRIVPEPTFCDFLADRKTLRHDVNTLIASLETRPTSTIHLVWSWYGAGKTHTLFYFANLCVREHSTLLPIYTECPRDAEGFTDLYRSAINQLSVPTILDAFLEFSTRPSMLSFTRQIDSDVESAFTQAALGGRPKELLLSQWLQGHPLPPKMLRELAVSGRVDRSEKCATVLADSIGLLTDPTTRSTTKQSLPARVVWIVDEIQRVESLTTRVQSSILSGLVGVFNRCPVGLSIVLAYSGEPRTDSLPAWIPADLADRIGAESPLLLPPMRSDEALVFMADLLGHFRLTGHPVSSPYFPFTKHGISAVIDRLAAAKDLKPRSLMQFFDVALRDLEPRFRDGTLTLIDEEVLLRTLNAVLPPAAKGPARSKSARQ